MKSLLLAFMLFIPTLAYAKDGSMPASQPAAVDDVKVPEEVPTTVDQVVDQGKEVVALGKEGKWMAFSAGVIWVLMFFVKLGRKKLSFMKNMKKRWLYIILGVMSLAAMLLSKFQGDLSWAAAVSVLTGSAAMGVLNDIVKRGILDKEPSQG